jgi:3-hydroxyisobutyrate dehydrogenase
MTQPQRIGFIGLGMMGLPMTTCLSRAGFQLFLADADAGRLSDVQAALNASALTADNASSLDVLITMLPNSTIVESVLLADGGWASQLKAGAVVIDMSSSEPARSRELGQKLKTLNLQYLDAPVSGGVKRAVDGSLAILVGGDESVMQRCRPLLDAMGKNILHIGDAGAGHAAKALNNFVSAAGLMATVEALHRSETFRHRPGRDGRCAQRLQRRHQHLAEQGEAIHAQRHLRFRLLDAADEQGPENCQRPVRCMDYPLTFGQSAIKVWNDVAQDATPATDHTEMYRMLAGEGERGGQ